MSKQADKYFKQFCQSFPEDKMNHAAFVQLIRTYARMCAEEDELQAFVDEHGYTYTSTARTGDVLHKHYPQHGTLSKLRTQKTATFRTLIKYLRDEQIEDDGEDFLR